MISAKLKKLIEELFERGMLSKEDFKSLIDERDTEAAEYLFEKARIRQHAVGRTNSICMQLGFIPKDLNYDAIEVKKEEDMDVIKALNDPNKTVIVQTAPAVRASLGEEFGMPIGSRVTGKMTAALKACGFDRVYDTNFGADLTIMEEGNELLDRLQNKGTLPMLTSCSPGWVRFMDMITMAT